MSKAVCINITIAGRAGRRGKPALSCPLPAPARDHISRHTARLVRGQDGKLKVRMVGGEQVSVCIAAPSRCKSRMHRNRGRPGGGLRRSTRSVSAARTQTCFHMHTCPRCRDADEKTKRTKPNQKTRHKKTSVDSANDENERMLMTF